MLEPYLDMITDTRRNILDSSQRERVEESKDKDYPKIKERTKKSKKATIQKNLTLIPSKDKEAENASDRMSSFFTGKGAPRIPKSSFGKDADPNG